MSTYGFAARRVRVNKAAAILAGSHSLLYRFTPATNALTLIYSGMRMEQWSSGIAYKGYWYFCGYDQDHGRALWRTDGTTAGTQLFAAFHPKFVSETYLLATAGDFLMFGADDGIHGVEPWITDGSAAGTKLLHDCVAITEKDDNPQLAGVIGSSVLFTALGRVDSNGISIRDLWKNDGTASGTTMVTALDNATVHNFVSNGSYVYYTRRDATPRLFATDAPRTVQRKGRGHWAPSASRPPASRHSGMALPSWVTMWMVTHIFT
jgi:ELWxxDGT repeat protein